MDEKTPLQTLLDTLPQVGKVEWIGIRRIKREPLEALKSVNAVVANGLEGDRYAGKSGRREVTLIQAEHITAIASLLHIESVHPQLLRRNIVVSGINLIALKGKTFHVGGAVLEMTGLCHPCSRMEEVFGDGGYNAVRNHGGITARVVTGGEIELGDRVFIQ